MSWGGFREGAGRPKQEIQRQNRTVRLSEQEWEIIKPVVNLIKKDNKNTAFLAVFLCRFFIEKISII